jgi:cell division protein FtsN
MMTARQLVATVCVLLLLGGALMTAGIWLGMRQAEPPDEVRSAYSPPSPAGEDSRERGRQTSPLGFPVVSPPVEDEDAPYQDIVPPAEPQEEPASDDSPVRGTPEDIEPAETLAPDPEPDVPVEEPVRESVEPETGLGDTLEPDDTDDVDGQPDPSPERAEGPLYSIQVAAFRTSERDKAEGFAADHSDLDPELVQSPDGEWVRVLVGRYTTRAEASARQAELRERKGFEECWVQLRQP